jgi:hypothetical protein
MPTDTEMFAGLNFSVSSALTAIAVVVAEVDGLTVGGGDWSAPPLSLPPLHATPANASTASAMRIFGERLN